VKIFTIYGGLQSSEGLWYARRPAWFLGWSTDVLARTVYSRLTVNEDLIKDVGARSVLPARLRQLGFLLGQEAADRGSAYFELAGDLGFADTFAV